MTMSHDNKRMELRFSIRNPLKSTCFCSNLKTLSGALVVILPTHTYGLHRRWDALLPFRNKYLNSAKKMLLGIVLQLDILIYVILGFRQLQQKYDVCIFLLTVLIGLNQNLDNSEQRSMELSSANIDRIIFRIGFNNI